MVPYNDEVIDVKLNLWNMTDGRTKAVRDYIEDLDHSESMDSSQETRFYLIVNKALSLSNNDFMLSVVGFRRCGVDLIYGLAWGDKA